VASPECIALRERTRKAGLIGKGRVARLGAGLCLRLLVARGRQLSNADAVALRAIATLRRGGFCQPLFGVGPIQNKRANAALPVGAQRATEESNALLLPGPLALQWANAKQLARNKHLQIDPRTRLQDLAIRALRGLALEARAVKSICSTLYFLFIN
jgi:hypothetical protein